MSKKKDLKFLKEIRKKLLRGEEKGDVTETQFAMQMIDDWIDELEDTCKEAK